MKNDKSSQLVIDMHTFKVDQLWYSDLVAKLGGMKLSSTMIQFLLVYSSKNQPKLEIWALFA